MTVKALIDRLREDCERIARGLWSIRKLLLLGPCWGAGEPALSKRRLSWRGGFRSFSVEGGCGGFEFVDFALDGCGGS